MRMTRLNQFFRDVGTATRTPAVRAAVKQAVEQELTRGLKRFTDGFEPARPGPSAAASTSSTAADGPYVTSLYRELLGRSPDVGGFNAHLSGLQRGMTRDALREVFLDSAEFKAKTAVPSTPVSEPTAPAQKTGAEQLRALIAADLKTASGREATQTDYAYWLPKLQEPCDSGFVTSGQMTGVEYYHRRMLGWQAGGEDMAISGPYAQSPDRPVGPVPSAIDVVGELTASPTSPTAPLGPSASSTEQLRKLIAADVRLAGGREATERDYAYWLPMMQSPCDSGFVTSGQMTGVEYYHRRMLGWQAGGEDRAISGPYAGSPDRPNGPVPSAVDVVGPLL